MEKTRENVLKAAIANLVDCHIGSVKGWTEQREVNMLMRDLSCSREMAIVILTACDDVREANAFDLI